MARSRFLLRAAEILSSEGFSSVLVAIDGASRYVGPHPAPSRKAWRRKKLRCHAGKRVDTCNRFHSQQRRKEKKPQASRPAAFVFLKSGRLTTPRFCAVSPLP